MLPAPVEVLKTDAKPRATVFTLMHETLEVNSSVAAEDLQLPADFKEKQ